MAGETLRSGAELLALFPDNTSGLIDAVQSRDFIVSSAVAVGFLEDGPGFTVTIVDGVSESINAGVTPATPGLELFWTPDGNLAWVPDYAAVVLPPGISRLATITTVMLIAKQGGGNSVYRFQYFEGGAAIGHIADVTLEPTDQLVTITETFLYDVEAGAPLELRVTGIATGDDLDMLDFRQTITSHQI